MTEQLSLWAQVPTHQEESARPVQETSLHDEIERELQEVLVWAKKHHWWELCYVKWDGSLERIGPGKDKWDEFATHPGLYDVERAFISVRQWDILETKPGAASGEFIVDVPVGLRLVDLAWGRKRLLELGEQCKYWPIHWRVNGLHQALQLGKPCWEHQALMATTEWLTTAIRAVELYRELSQTSIKCASCKKPLYFPGLTVEQVRERFKNSTCSLCLNRMIIPNESEIEMMRAWLLEWGRQHDYPGFGFSFCHRNIPSDRRWGRVSAGEDGWKAHLQPPYNQREKYCDFRHI